MQLKRQLRLSSRHIGKSQGGIATKQFRPLAPPAHFNRGGRIESLHFQLYKCRLKSVPDRFAYGRFETFSITPNRGRIHCFALVDSLQDGWEVESPDEAVKWYNLFTYLLGEPLHFNFMGFGQENNEQPDEG